MTLERRKLRRSIPFLDGLDNHLFTDIKRIFVFGRDGDAAFFITKNDHVYAYGKNSCGCLGLGVSGPVNEPAQVTALTRRKIVEFAAGRSHVLALTKSGQVFACGNNEYGQLALTKCIECDVPQLVESLRRDRVVAIACGAFHSLALTSRGLVMAWGFNFFGQLGVGDNDQRHEPVCVVNLRRENIVEIGCGQHHSVALSRKGDLFAFGHNGHGQLGIGQSGVNFKNIPIKIIHSEEFNIKQVTCGQDHVLAVSEDGQLLGFGSNYYGQLGTGTREDQHEPIRICEDQKIKDIISSPFSNSSVARTKKRNSLVFGKCGDNWLLTPVESPDLAEIEKPREKKPHTRKSRTGSVGNKSSKEQAFVQVNATTAHAAVVVKNNKRNRFFNMLYFLKQKFLF